MPRAATMSEIVLLGAGPVHLDVLRRFALRPPWHARLTLVGPEPEIPRPGTLPGLIRGDRTVTEASVDLGRLCIAAGARLILAEPIGLIADAGTVVLPGRPALAFDIVSIDLEGESIVPGADRGGTPLQPLASLMTRLRALEAALPDGARLGIIGGGTTGPELALALASRWRGRIRLVLVSGGPEPVEAAPPRARRAVRSALVAAGVELVSAVHAGPLTDGRLALSDGSFLHIDAALWAGDTAPPGWLADSGLACDATGRIAADANLCSVSHRTVFAAGDCVTPTPASPAAPLLAASLRRAAAGRAPGGTSLPRVPRPSGWPGLPGWTGLPGWAGQQGWAGPPGWPACLELGKDRAVAWAGGVAVTGDTVARAKAWLDRWQLRRSVPRPAWPLAAHPLPGHPLALPAAALPARPGASGSTSSRALPAAAAAGGMWPAAQPNALAAPHCAPAAPANAPATQHYPTAAPRRDPELPHRHGEPIGASALIAGDGGWPCGANLREAPAALIPPPGQAIVPSTIFLTACNLPDLFVFGQIAAAHALSEPGARGLQPWMAVAIASVPGDPADARARADLADMAAGLRSVLAVAGCALADIHTGTAAEPSLGIAVTSLTDPAHHARRRRLRAGDALVLTKPLGSGIVLAGQAGGQARGAWLRAATDAMRGTNEAAHRVLRGHGMTACTAVNGAGLGGHLGDLLRAAGLICVLWPQTVPLLPGTADLLARDRPPALGRTRRERRTAQPVPAGPARADAVYADATRLAPAHAGPALPDPAYADAARPDPGHPDAGGADFATLLAAPEISGGLIAGIPGARAEACRAALRAEGLQAAIIGIAQAAEPDLPLIRLERR